MLDGIGLTDRNADGIRLLPDGKPLQIVVETAGEETEQTDVLELIRDHWSKVGIELFIKPSQREVFYSRINAGETQMAVWWGLENAMSARDEPAEFGHSAKTSSMAGWGLGRRPAAEGEEPALGRRKQMGAEQEWGLDQKCAREALAKILTLGPTVFTIGIVSGVEQLVVVQQVTNVPEHCTYNFDGA